jgi:hypothetical protein
MRDLQALERLYLQSQFSNFEMIREGCVAMADESHLAGHPLLDNGRPLWEIAMAVRHGVPYEQLAGRDDVAHVRFTLRPFLSRPYLPDWLTHTAIITLIQRDVCRELDVRVTADYRQVPVDLIADNQWVDNVNCVTRWAGPTETWRRVWFVTSYLRNLTKQDVLDACNPETSNNSPPPLTTSRSS